MTGKIFIKLLAAVLCLLIVAMVAVDLFSTRVAETTYREMLERDLTEKGRMLALVLRQVPVSQQPEELGKLASASRTRITWIDGAGNVLADTAFAASRMENHRLRPEFVSALAGNTGSIQRDSATVGKPYLYVAVPVPGGGALRLAVPLADIDSQVDVLRRRMIIATMVAFLPAILLAALIARWISERLGRIIAFATELARGNFRARLAPAGTDELGQLESKLSETGEKLEEMFQELSREHAELEKLERVRKDFVINVSHELRTPLASIQGYTETLLDGAIHDEKHNVKFLGIIRQNAVRLANLTADLLTLSRIELKQQRFSFASYNLELLLQSSLDSFVPIAAKKEVDIHLDSAGAMEVFCDAEAFNQILTNFIDNALKYTPSGGQIVVGSRRMDDKPMAEVFVRDSGIGIPKADLSRLFERFYRVDKARSRELGGTGLGLAIVKHLVRAQGGEVRVVSEVGQGSEFSFTLPFEDLGLSDQRDIRGQLTVL